MKITRIEPQQSSAERLNIHVDGEFRFALAAEIVLAEGLQVGTSLSDGQIASLEQRDSEWKAKEAALRLLSFRPRSAVELRRRLREKQFADEVIESCVARLVEVGLVRDEEFAGMLVRDRVRFKPQGRRRLMQELRAKGVDEETARGAVDEALEAEGVGELELARQAARKWRPRAGEERERGRRRLYGLLARRGFGSETIRAVMDEIAAGEA
jgi:regulatory protein